MRWLAKLWRGVDGRPAVLPEAIGLLILLLVFTRLHAAAGTDAAAATANALSLQSIEQALRRRAA